MAAFSSERELEKKTCPLHLVLESPWGDVRITLPFVILPGPGDLVIIDRQTLHEGLDIDIMGQSKVIVQQGGICKDRKKADTLLKANPTNARMTESPRGLKNLELLMMKMR